VTRALCIVVLVAAGLAGCRDHEAVCRRAIENRMSSYDTDAWIATCVRERWSDRKIECYLRSGRGTFLSLFCEDL
jgi:hypothetical protein